MDLDWLRIGLRFCFDLILVSLGIGINLYWMWARVGLKFIVINWWLNFNRKFFVGLYFDWMWIWFGLDDEDLFWIRFRLHSDWIWIWMKFIIKLNWMCMRFCLDVDWICIWFEMEFDRIGIWICIVLELDLAWIDLIHQIGFVFVLNLNSIWISFNWECIRFPFD